MLLDMPKVTVKRIHNFNKERLVAGLLPTTWFLILGVAVTLIFMIKQPKTLGDILFVFISSLVLGTGMVAVYRVSHTRIIQHWIRWHDSGIGGLIGRDLHPVPHRFVEMSDEEAQWMKNQRKQDLQRARELQKSLNTIRKEEAMRKKGKIRSTKRSAS